MVSYVQLGNKTGEDINCTSIDLTMRPLLTHQIPDNFLSPALWSATEVAIAVFSCSIPSLTYLFRRVIGSKYFDSGMPYATADNANRATYQGERGCTRDDSSFQRLGDDDDGFDSIALVPTNENAAVNVVGSPHDHKNSHELDQIVVKNDFDVERSTPGRS